MMNQMRNKLLIIRDFLGVFLVELFMKS